jgi:ABC-2 type transport system ATP-binding protein
LFIYCAASKAKEWKTMTNYIDVKNLTKRYGELIAVNNLSFQVSQGEIFGFLGPNGAGKTTTLNILSTLSDYDQGEISLAGYSLPKDSVSIKKRLGLVPQEIALYKELNAAENVSLFASLYGLKGATLKKSVNDALEFVGLADMAKKRTSKMSGGMQRRLNIACGIAHKPQIIIMDEPTVGVDARSRDQILRSIQLLRDEGATILYTSHYMPEVQEICDRIAIIDKGKLAAIGTEEELLSYVTDRKMLFIRTDGMLLTENSIVVEKIRTLPGVKNVKTPDASTLNIDVALSLTSITPILSILSAHDIAVQSITEESSNLETTFLALTGSELTPLKEDEEELKK